MNRVNTSALIALLTLALAQLACTVDKVTPPASTVTVTAAPAVSTQAQPAPVLTHSTEPAPDALCVRGDVAGLWLRNAPEGAQLVAIPANTLLTVDTPGEWARVTVADVYGETRTGWVKSEFIGVCR